mmetsp:Transcript_75597/g.162067  ORF Transcript_75597/g.162067 Transcript_75597/m.162067 type:complete len:258 (+) Transcript_75597:733-1506(+)
MVEVAPPEANPTKPLVELQPHESPRWNSTSVVILDLVADPLPGLVLVSVRHPCQDGPVLRPTHCYREVSLQVLIPLRREAQVCAAALVDVRLAMPEQLRAVSHPADTHLLPILPRLVHTHDPDAPLQEGPDIVDLTMHHHLSRLRHLHSALAQAKHAVILLLPLLGKHFELLRSLVPDVGDADTDRLLLLGLESHRQEGVGEVDLVATCGSCPTEAHKDCLFPHLLKPLGLYLSIGPDPVAHDRPQQDLALPGKLLL